MTNLADLLPAGGGQNNTDFVADGTISSGAPVILTSDGKAAPISSTSGVVGASATFESATTSETDAVYDSNSNKIVVVYADQANSYYATSVVGTITGGSTNTVSWGTPVVFASYGCSSFAPVFQSHDNQIVCAFVAWGGGYSSRIQVIAGEVSGTSMNWYSSGAHDPDGSTGTNYISAAYDSNEQKTVLAWVKGSASTESCVVSVSGTGTSANATTGTVVQVNGGGDARNTSCCFDSNSNKMVVLFNKVHDSYKGFGRVGTVSGTSISYGTEAQFMSGKQPLYIGSGFDASANKIVITGADNANNSQGDCCLGTVSGTDITYSTPVVFSTGGGSGVSSGQNANGFPTIYNPDTTKTFIAFSNGGDDSSGQYIEGTVSGSTISFGSVTTFEAPVSGQTSVTQISAAYDTNVDRFLVAFVPYATGPSYGVGRVIQVSTSTLTATNLLGLAPEAISNTATGTINTWGSRCESSSLLADSLSLASADTTSGNTNKENVSMAYDSNADRTILVYRDGGDSDKLKCIIGTLSGTSTSWGTAVEIVGATAGNRGTAVVYDSNAQRVLIAYTKASDNYTYVRVGEISGTSVTLGTEVAASSSNSYYPELSYDVADQKVLLVFANAGDNYYPYSAACTITAVGNSVAVTTPASIASRNAYDPFGLAYNVNDGKHVLDITDNTSTGYAYVLTMSSGSISVGAEASYSPGFTPRQSFCVYDSSAQKIVRGYYSNSDPRPVEFAVASISGTNVSFGTAATCFAGNSGMQVSGTFYSSINQLAFFNMPFATTSVETNFGTVSGTTITFGTATTVASSGVSSGAYFDITYDSTAQKLIYAYRASTFDAVVGSFGTTPLTVTSDYYVQEDGTISTDTGGQLIGNAIKTNQINIKDYTG